MSKLNIKPLADRVLVEPLKAETKTASGIIIPDTAKEKPQKGNVVAVGPGTKENPITVKVGDSVLYGRQRDVTTTSLHDASACGTSPPWLRRRPPQARPPG